MTIKTKYKIEIDCKVVEIKDDKYAKEEIKEYVTAIMHKRWIDAVDFEIEKETTVIDGMTLTGCEDQIIIQTVRYEPGTLEKIEDILTDYGVTFNKAATGTIYIDLFNCDYESIRISDHDANVPNKRNSSNFEIDLVKVDDIDNFAYDIDNAVMDDDTAGLEIYRYEQ